MSLKSLSCFVPITKSIHNECILMFSIKHQQPQNTKQQAVVAEYSFELYTDESRYNLRTTWGWMHDTDFYAQPAVEWKQVFLYHKAGEEMIVLLVGITCMMVLVNQLGSHRSCTIKLTVNDLRMNATLVTWNLPIRAWCFIQHRQSKPQREWRYWAAICLIHIHATRVTATEFAAARVTVELCLTIAPTLTDSTSPFGISRPRTEIGQDPRFIASSSSRTRAHLEI